MSTAPVKPDHTDHVTGRPCSTSVQFSDEHRPVEHGRWTATAVWTAGLAVAVAAAAATAHGLYEVVAAAGNPPVIAGLYPLITDGLALVAYTATTRLVGRGRGYAWAIVVLAAGLSGLAQASYLAGGVHTSPTWLRAGVGGWPAIAAALVAHLLYLLGTHHHAAQPGVQPVQPATVQQAGVQLRQGRVPVERARSEQPSGPNGGPPQNGYRPEQPSAADAPSEYPAGAEQDSVQPAGGPHRPKANQARDRAAEAARAHLRDRGDLPTVTELARQAGVSRGTASGALKHLRATKPALQIVNPAEKARTSR